MVPAPGCGQHAEIAEIGIPALNETSDFQNFDSTSDFLLLSKSLSYMETYISTRKIDSQWEFAVRLRELNLGNKLERWDGEGGRRDVQVEGDRV